MDENSRLKVFNPTSAYVSWEELAMQERRAVLRQDTSRGGGPPRVFVVGVASLICVRDNINRQKITFTNDSDTVIYLSKFDVAVLNAGIRINALGGGYVDEPDTEGYMYTGPWSAISSAATKNLCIIEEM